MTAELRKVAVAGAHSTGKSTFVARLHYELSGRRVNAERVHTRARSAKELGFPILSGHTFESTAWLMAETIQQEMVAARHSNVVLVDRPVPDALGYLLAALRHTGRIVEEERLRRLDAICANWIYEYDLVIVTEVDPSVPLGGGRDTDHRFRVAVGEAIREVVSRMTSKYLVLRRGEEEDALLAAVEVVLRGHCQSKWA